MKWPRPALAGAAALAAIGLAGLVPQPAKATNFVFSSTWQDAPTVGTGSPEECLGVQGGNMNPGTPIVTWTCNGHPDQTWYLTGAPGNGAVTQIVDSQDTSKCLGVQNRATNDGANLVIWNCNGSSDQNWLFMPWTADNRNGPFGCFTIQNENAAPKVLGVRGGTPFDGAQTVIWDLLFGHHDQVWCPFQ